MPIPTPTPIINSTIKPDVAFILRNVVPIWQRLLKSAQQRVLLFSPYLNTVKTLRALPSEVPLTVFTEFSLELFASGSSALRVLKEIRSWENAEVFWLPGLHAKIIVVDDHAMTLGSQNMTVRGEKNLEATALIASPEPVATALPTLEAWMKRALPITDAMIAEVERFLPPAAKMYREYSRFCCDGQEILRNLAEAEVAARQRSLEERAVLDLQRLQEAQRALRERKQRLEEMKRRVSASLRKIEDAVGHVQKRLETFFPGVWITEEIARDFVGESAWAPKHSCGHPVQTPGAAANVFYSQSLGYCWPRARNKRTNRFTVGRAIRHCRDKLVNILDDKPWLHGHFLPEHFMNALKYDMNIFIVNCDDEFYTGIFPMDGDDILFGFNSINVDDFVRCFLYRYAGVRDLFNTLEELKILRAELDNVCETT